MYQMQTEWKKSSFQLVKMVKYMVINFIFMVQHYTGCAKTFVRKSDSNKIFDMKLPQEHASTFLVAWKQCVATVE